MKILVFVFSTLISFSALADFTGTWSGQGTLDDSEGTQAYCKSMSFEFAQTATSFTLNSGTADCDLFRLQWKPVTLEVKDGDLISNGDRIGTIGADFIFVKRFDADSGLTDVYTIEISSAGLELKQTSSDAEGNVLFSIEGLLTK